MIENPPENADGEVFDRLRRDVVDAGLCTHCGTCAGLSGGTLTMRPAVDGPVPVPAGTGPVILPASAYEACPGRVVDYPALNQAVFGRMPQTWLIGYYRRLFVGYATSADIRRAGASGGVITQTLLYLLATERIDGAVVSVLGLSQPWLAQAIIARTPAEILAASQSIYQPVPVNVILAEMDHFDGRLAYVGLPDQVASLRQLQKIGHAGANKVDYILGPYVGTNMTSGAVESFLRTHGIAGLEDITRLRYRAGEWPGHLEIHTRSGKVLRAAKFYYNYLIPFYITRSSLLAVDFTNELTDISVGDAWHPHYEVQGEGFSVVVARSEKGEALLHTMRAASLLQLEDVSLETALEMHGHMLDFKKRGSFIRLGWRRSAGQPVPEYGYHPVQTPGTRRILVEMTISLIFWVCRRRLSRKLVEYIPIGILGLLFNTLRKSWKRLSKPTKRKGLHQMQFTLTEE